MESQSVKEITDAKIELELNILEAIELFREKFPTVRLEFDFKESSFLLSHLFYTSIEKTPVPEFTSSLEITVKI